MIAQIALASASPRRRALLRQIGVRFVSRPAALDEVARPGETPDAFVRRMAREKALAAVAAHPRSALPALGADTAAVAAGRILGKPAGRAEALEMLALLSGRAHRVVTAVAISDGARTLERLSESVVWLRATTAAERSAYWASGEPCDKAGGYALQGRAAAFIRRIDGSCSGVMGLPLFETAELLRAFAAVGAE